MLILLYRRVVIFPRSFSLLNSDLVLINHLNIWCQIELGASQIFIARCSFNVLIKSKMSSNILLWDGIILCEWNLRISWFPSLSGCLRFQDERVIKWLWLIVTSCSILLGLQRCLFRSLDFLNFSLLFKNKRHVRNKISVTSVFLHSIYFGIKTSLHK